MLMLLNCDDLYPLRFLSLLLKFPLPYLVSERLLLLFCVKLFLVLLYSFLENTIRVQRLRICLFLESKCSDLVPCYNSLFYVILFSINVLNFDVADSNEFLYGLNLLFKVYVVQIRINLRFRVTRIMFSHPQVVYIPLSLAEDLFKIV